MTRKKTIFVVTLAATVFFLVVNVLLVVLRAVAG